MSRETWASRFGFIMATAGYSIGLGNIWRFPYMTGTHGGGAFLLVYLGFALLIGVPLLTLEIGLGRHAGLTPIAGMRKVTGSKVHPWNVVGWLGVITALLVESYYVILIGWIFGYFAMIVSGDLTGASRQELTATFNSFTSSPGPVLGWTLLVMLLLGLIVGRGLRRGLERMAVWAMPVLLLLLVVLAARSLSFEGAGKGLAWYVTPDFSQVDGQVLLAALGQAFFSIGISMAAAFGFGSYLSREKSDVPGNAAIVVGCDTAIAFLAGLVIFPALFAFGLSPDSGPGLLFVTMTQLFADMPAGQLFGGGFFFLLILAAMTSAGAVLDVLTVTLTDVWPMPRRRATWITSGLVTALAVPILLSQAEGSTLRLFGLNLFDAADLVAGKVLLPVGALALALYAAWGWGFDALKDEINHGAGRVRVTGGWRPFIVFLIPMAVLIVLLSGFGLFS